MFDDKFYDELDEWWEWAKRAEYNQVSHTGFIIDIRSSNDGLIATPDDWLDTYLWIKQLKEKI